MRAALVVVSVLLSLALTEAVLRVTVPAGDLLMPALTRNDVLGRRLRPGTAGFDEWGFRNPTRPARADVVAIGDSFTYGYAARRADAWPSQLARLSGLSVYNLGMGEWGPAQYYCALRIFALRLSPRAIVIGLYLGNDLEAEVDAAAVAACDSLDPTALAHLDREPLSAGGDERRFGAARDWLSRHSMFYQALKLGLPQLAGSALPALVVGDRSVVREVQGQRVILRTASWLVTYPELVGARLPAVVAILVRMAAVCRERGLICMLVLIPSREAVYGQLARDPRPRATMEAEAAVSAALRAAVGDRFTLVDPLGALRDAVTSGTAVFPNSDDIHLNAAGYGVLAREIAAGLRALRP